MGTSSIDQQILDESAIDRFDEDYIGESLFQQLVQLCVELRPEITSIADFGGGNGRLLDRVLDCLPDALGVNYEVSAYLRRLNKQRPNKIIVSDSFLSQKIDSKYDLIFINWVFHHLVGVNIGSTSALMQQAADVAFQALRPNGLLVVSENLLKSVFPVGVSSGALFGITKSRFLKPIVSRMRDGKTIAGVGIYYLSEQRLIELLSKFELIRTFFSSEHDYGWKLKPIGITRVEEKLLVFRKP